MKLTIMQNYEEEEMFLKMKNRDRWAQIQRNSHWIPGIEGLDWHQPSNYVGSRMGLTWFYEIEAWNEVMNKHEIFS
jgi:hypothetical protein